MMDPTGTNIQQLTFNEWTDENPDWSPDGTSIVYEAATQIFSLNVSAAFENSQEAVKAINANEFNDYAPPWSLIGE